jgi:hypothetical protein
MIRKKPFNFAIGVNKKFVYTGLQHAISATGGFSIEENIKPLAIQVIQNIAKYDVTDSVQILYDVNSFNNKLGQYDGQTYEMDSIMICASEFIGGLQSSHQINSVGKLENLYKDFVEYVNSFLNYEEGFSSIYLMDQQFEVEKEKMDVTDLYETLIKQTENIYGTYNDLYGNITVNGTNKLLQNMKTLNLFGNRVSTTETGFIEGDLIYIPYGLTISLHVELDAENLQLNKQGIQYVEKMNLATDYDTCNGCQQTIATSEKITRIVKIPLLIKLAEINAPSGVEPVVTTSTSVSTTPTIPTPRPTVQTEPTPTSTLIEPTTVPIPEPITDITINNYEYKISDVPGFTGKILSQEQKNVVSLSEFLEESQKQIDMKKQQKIEEEKMKQEQIEAEIRQKEKPKAKLNRISNSNAFKRQMRTNVRNVTNFFTDPKK